MDNVAGKDMYHQRGGEKETRVWRGEGVNGVCKAR